MSDIKTIGFGAAVIVASIGGAAVVSSPITKIEYISASESVDDVTATTLAPLGAENKTICEKTWATVKVSDGPELGWVCGGAWLPVKEQKAMNKKYGDEAIRIELLYAPDDKGKLIANATVTNGPLPAKP